MFNIGIGELLFIAILVLVVVGPERLPKVMREFGRIVRQIRLVVNELTSEFADELQPIQELQQPLQELQQLADDINPIKQVTKISLDLDQRARQTSTPQKSAASPASTSSPNLVKPPSPPSERVKPTAAFRKPAASSRPANHPMRVLSQARRTQQSTTPEEGAES